MANWNDYVANTKDYPARPLLVEALSYVKHKRKALDLGAGALNDTRRLIADGFKHVDVVDSNPATAELAKGLPEGNVSTFEVPFNEFVFPLNRYDLVNAQNALPFAGPEHIEMVMDNMKESFASQGIFTGNFFGFKDAWAGNHPEIAFIAREKLEEYFNSKEWDMHKFDEYEGMGKLAAGGEKYWHRFSIIASRII